jgi:tetratricopeptide (TPR) repeat protein
MRTHVVRLLVATALSFALMFALLMLAVQYLKRDWTQKQQRAWASGAQRHAETPAEETAEPTGWAYAVPPAAADRYLAQLAAEPLSRENGWLILARGLSDKTDAALVISALRMAMAISGESADIRNDFGAAYLQQRRMRPAADQFAAAEQIRPGFAPALYNRALCAISDRQPEKAVRLLGRYLGQRPEDVVALRLQATLLSQLGRTDHALLLLEKFLRTQPPDQPLFLEAAQLAARRGLTGKALRYLETALNGNSIQAVVRTYQSAVFREIRLSGEGDRLAAHMADRARMAFSTPIPEADIQPLREIPPEAIVR